MKDKSELIGGMTSALAAYFLLYSPVEDSSVPWKSDGTQHSRTARREELEQFSL